MGTDFLSFIQRYELILFFAGYPLLYTLVSGLPKWRMSLPVVYAMAGTLFLLFLFWRANRPGSLVIIALRSWGVLAVLFWIPWLGKLRLWSLLHSLVFFALLVEDMVGALSAPYGRETVGGDMRIFSISFFLNALLLVLVRLVIFIRELIRRRAGV